MKGTLIGIAVGILLGLAAIATTLGSVAVAYGQSPTQAPATEVHLLKYLDWITANSEFEYNGEPLPPVVPVAQETLDNLTAGHDTRAAYDPAVNTIYVREGFDLRQPRHEATLVHELVHFLQGLHGAYDDPLHCAYALEPAAYRVQEAWLDAHNISGDRPDWFTIFVKKSYCHSPHT